jgi:hypothetical protein
MGKYADKVNTSPNQKKLKAALETKGHTNVEVWWEPLEPGCEMGGPFGGYFFCSDQNPCQEPIGYSFSDAMEAIKEWPWLDVREPGGEV